MQTTIPKIIVTVANLKTWNAIICGGKTAIVFDESGLTSAANAPLWLDSNQPGQTPLALAAQLSYSLAKGHCFQDGNKRTALVTGNEYLRGMNHKLLYLGKPEDYAKDGAMLQVALKALTSVAQGEMTKEELAEVYEKLANK